MRTQTVRWLGWSLFGLSVAIALAALLIAALTPPAPFEWPRAVGLPIVAALLAWPAVGALLVSRRPENPVGWIFCAFGLAWLLRNLAQIYALDALVKRPDLLPGGVFMAWVASWTLGIALATFAFLLLLFPDGRPPSPRWRAFTGFLGIALGVHAFLLAFTPGPLIIEFRFVRNPFGIEPAAALLRPLHEASFWPMFWPAAYLAGVVSLAFRYYRAGWGQRQQLKWFASAALIEVVALALVVGSYDWQSFTLANSELLVAGMILTVLAMVAMPVASGIAILKYHLLDIDVVMRRSVVYAALSLLVTGLYAGIAALVGIAVGRRFPVGLAVALTIAVMLGFQPARRRLDRLAARLVFGNRPTGYELLARFGETLEHAFDLSELSSQIASAVRGGLDLSWARVSLNVAPDVGSQPQPVAADGLPLEEEAPANFVVPLTHGSELVGVIECGPKTNGSLTATDEQLLATLGRQAALGIHNARLAAELSARLEEIARQAQDLAASRARIIKAQDAERRRIERNIHDGIQQQIVALNTRLRLARNQLRRDPALADDTLKELQAQSGQTLDDIRELAQGIHPTVLTDQGLVTAIEDRASRLPMGVVVEAEPVLRQTRFAEQIEGAAYFFASEALTNVLKHASVDQATVRLSLRHGKLGVEVADQGRGFALAANVSGSGLAGIRDRIEAVGGKVQIASRPGQGSTLTAELPAAPRHSSDV